MSAQAKKKKKRNKEPAVKNPAFEQPVIRPPAPATDERSIEIDFAALPRQRLETMAEAAEEVVDCHRVLAKTGDNIVGELLRDVEGFFEWDHYPDGDVYDGETHAQYYYHSHPDPDRPTEHGHFHTFMRPDGFPAGVKPAEVPEGTTDEDADEMSHLIAISMDKFGVPIRLFTVNLWVTNDTWYAADDVIGMLDRFEIDLAQPSWPVNRWITGMVMLFQPQIVELIRRRDTKLAEWAKAYPDRNPYRDHELEVTSMIDISIDDQVGAITAALNKAG